MNIILGIFLVAFTLHWEIGNSAEVSGEAEIRGICKKICAVRGQCTNPKAKPCQACQRNCRTFIDTIELKENEAEVITLYSTIRRLVELAGTRGDQGEETTNLLKILVKAMVQQEDNEIDQEESAKTEDEEPHSQYERIEKQCKAMCNFQRCEAENCCRTCTSECIDQYYSLLETQEISKLIKDFVQKISEIEIVEEKGEYDLKIDDVCKAMCNLQGQCKEEFDNCKICTSECSAEFTRFVGTDSLDEESRNTLQKILLVISNADVGSILMTEEMPVILKDFLQNLTKTNKSKNKNPQEATRQPTELEYMLCDEVCKVQGKCNLGNSPECKTCFDKCLNSVNITNGMILLDDKTFDQYRKLMSIFLLNLENNSNLKNLLGSGDIDDLQYFFLFAYTLEDDIFLNDQETIQYMMSVIRKLENSTLVSIVTEDDENKESRSQSEELCKAMCKFQGVCAEAEDSCRTCTSECNKQLVSNKMLENINEDTQLQLERLLLVIRNSDDDSLLETPEMSKLVKDLLQKIRGMDIVEEKDQKENVDRENEAEFQLRKLCKSMCKLQGMCIDTQSCKICTMECVEQLKSDEYIQGMNGDSEFPLEELLLVISNVKPVSSKVLQNLDEETKLQLERFLLVIGNGDTSILMSPEMSNIMKDLLTKLREIDVTGKTGEGEMGDLVTQSKKACEAMCKFQRMCLNKNSNNCKSCILECTEKLGENKNLKTPEGIKLLEQLTESVKINVDGSITVNSDTDKYLAKLTQVIHGHASTASPTMPAQTTKPVQFLSTKRVCKMECADRCMNRTSRREILDEVPRKCRSCIRTICNLFRMYNTDCPFDTMKNQCIEFCPVVPNDIKDVNEDCGVCFENCVLRERQKRKLKRRRQRDA
uniref:uncharacterized protein LOC120329700 isoform X3 n=1 Tax=Styela clava TaxID=7725 RepID=UPI00193ADE7C|nr:uncharacterized protein LOC120329700 isoform X3 [Styela clava]